MKVHKKYHNKLARQNIELKTAKQIEDQLQKQIFFSQLISQIEAQFPREHLELFLQHINNTTVRQKKGKLHPTDDSNFPPLPNLKLNDNDLDQDNNNEDEFIFKRIDANVFQFSQNKPFPCKIFKNDSEIKKYVSTPKLQQTSRGHFTSKRLFDMDAKMKRNYDRVKQRLIFTSKQDTFRQAHPNRASLLMDRTSRTQRCVRYKTQAQQKQNQTEEKFIPPMLMGQLLNRSMPKKQKRLNTCQDRRIQCFVNTVYSSPMQRLRRYKINQ